MRQILCTHSLLAVILVDHSSVLRCGRSMDTVTLRTQSNVKSDQNRTRMGTLSLERVRLGAGHQMCASFLPQSSDLRQFMRHATPTTRSLSMLLLPNVA